MKSLSEVIGRITWVRPDHDAEHDEVTAQLDENPPNMPDDVKRELKVLKDLHQYTMAMKAGKVKVVKPDKTDKILNTDSDTGSYHKLEKAKRERTEHHFKRGRVEMPILLRNKETKKKWLLAGNTRLTFNSQEREKKTPCLVLEY
jgi:hypothetical protein